MKKFTCFLLITVVVLSLTACSIEGNNVTPGTSAAPTGTPAATDETPTNTDEKVKITILNLFQDPNQLNYIGYWFDMLEEWKAAHPNVEVDNQGIADRKVFLERRKAAFASDDLPNIMWNTGSMDIQEFVKYDYLLNLQPYFDADKEWYDMFVESLFAGGRFPGKEGTYAVPFVGQVSGLYVNKKLLNDAGITENPKTIEEFEAVMDTLLKQGKTVPFLYGGKGTLNPSMIITLIGKMYGGNWVQDVYAGKAKYTDEISRKAYVKFKEWLDKGYFGDVDKFWETDTTGARNGFYNMDCAYMFSNSHVISVALEKSVDKDQLSYQAFPYFKDYPQFEGTFPAGVGDHFSVCDTGSKLAQDLSVDLIKYTTITKNFQRNAEIQQYSLLPVVKGIEVPASGLPSIVQDFQNSIKIMKNGNPPATHDAFGAEAREVMIENLTKYMLGEITLDTCLQKTQEVIDKAIAAMKM